ncbi:MAG TPA: protein-L-isoaspartate(D-aspartate) O-methyltransferase [Spirochaetota bacterium]|nr:protein-L-isoaspartate(D-aspartate) O-methyltransferase [Spirochaetota bacterium]HOM09884.1 protein-L-isoaspartate(D-aspartate) O-methyltransferase [Spirochaetota bacterium]HPP48772.1 protein-L-isoaspartate(D-aspartate) O-methyltransferase [Spirochaetota bacterium]
MNWQITTVIFILIAVAIALVSLFNATFNDVKGESLQQLRELMVKKQIEARGIRDPRVLQAMLQVERHKFVPELSIPQAYEDHPLPIGYGQTISQPYIVALMTELCELDGSEKVLEIGTGSGYQAAILSLLAKEVFTIEIVEPLGKQAALRLKSLGYKNVTVKIGDGYKGWPEHAPFDVIMLTAAPPTVPDALLSQLKEDGGILVAPVGDYHQELVKIVRNGNNYSQKVITYVRFVPMVPAHE